MPPDARDAAYLWDMLEAAREVERYTAAVSFAAYEQDRMRQRAVERALEIVGEAARRVSDPFKQTHSQIPWRPIIAQRNVIAHEYGEIVQERLWRVAREHIPTLIAELEPLIPDLPDA
jgi:uncharacterized protein with HEPN domain